MRSVSLHATKNYFRMIEAEGSDPDEDPAGLRFRDGNLAGLQIGSGVCPVENHRPHRPHVALPALTSMRSYIPRSLSLNTLKTIRSTEGERLK